MPAYLVEMLHISGAYKIVNCPRNELNNLTWLPHALIMKNSFNQQSRELGSLINPMSCVNLSFTMFENNKQNFSDHCGTKSPLEIDWIKQDKDDRFNIGFTFYSSSPVKQ